MTLTRFAQFNTNEQLRKQLLAGQMGLELEINRVTAAGRLIRQPYPVKFGDRQSHPFLTSDYSEGMIEMVTPAVSSMAAARQELAYLLALLRTELKPGEGLWPLSMPPVVLPADLKWLDDNFERYWVQDYRDWLQKKYGSVHAIISGPHVNFSLGQNLIKTLARQAGATSPAAQIAFNNQIYFQLAQGIEAHRWLFIYLFGASPLNLNPLDQVIPPNLAPVRSLRNSQFGYVNDKTVDISYAESFAHHVQQLKTAVQNKQLYSAHEFYGTVRFKGAEDYQTLLDEGIKYLELRAIDTNPFDELGIAADDLNAIQLILLWLFLQGKDYTVDELTAAHRLADQVALQPPTEMAVVWPQGWSTILKELQIVNSLLDNQFITGLTLIEQRLQDPMKTPAAHLLKLAGTSNELQTWGQQVA